MNELGTIKQFISKLCLIHIKNAIISSVVIGNTQNITKQSENLGIKL